MVKPGKLGPTKKRVLRLIINLIPHNCIMRRIKGDIEQLEGPLRRLRLVLHEGEVALMWGDDLVCGFYLFEMPAAWRKYFAMGMPLKASELGLPGDEEYYLAVGVMPDGPTSRILVSGVSGSLSGILDIAPGNRVGSVAPGVRPSPLTGVRPVGVLAAPRGDAMARKGVGGGHGRVPHKSIGGSKPRSATMKNPEHTHTHTHAHTHTDLRT